MTQAATSYQEDSSNTVPYATICIRQLPRYTEREKRERQTQKRKNKMKIKNSLDYQATIILMV